jgi:alpha-galactosidase
LLPFGDSVVGMNTLLRTLGLLALLGMVQPVNSPQARAQTTEQPKSRLNAPPMGWNSWNAYGCNIDENKIKSQAEAMAKNGMLGVGYRFVVMDDCWAAKVRDAQGNLQADPQKFPGGIKALADHIHALGLKFGMYSSRGTKTCAGYPASQDFEQQDALQLERWGVDYLKYDNCYTSLDEKTQYEAMQAALSSLKRPIIFSVCSWWFRPWIPSIGNLWRTTYDIQDVWESQALPSSNGEQSVVSIADTNNLYASYARPGHFNDPDMLMVGNHGKGGLGGPGMNDLEYRSHFGLWAIMSAPLMAGNPLASMDAITLETLTNPEVIAVNQSAADSPAHTQGVRVRRNSSSEVWAKPLEDGSVVVLLLNRADQAADLRVNWSDVGLLEANVKVRDLWQRQDLGVFDAGFTAQAVPAHGSVMLRLRGMKLPPETKTIIRLEAESSSNTLTEPAQIKACEKCSGKALVGNIRGPGSLRFNKVFVSRTGSVPVTVYFNSVSTDALLKITTSAGANNFVRVHSSGDQAVTSLRINLELERGENTITFSLPGWKAPSIDRIVYETGRR